METIHSLRKQGYKVRVLHERIYNGIYAGKLYPIHACRNENLSAKGGKTHIDVTSPENKTVSGEAVCRPDETFNRKLAIKIALGRALKSLQV